MSEACVNFRSHQLFQFSRRFLNVGTHTQLYEWAADHMRDFEWENPIILDDRRFHAILIEDLVCRIISVVHGGIGLIVANSPYQPSKKSLKPAQPEPLLNNIFVSQSVFRAWWPRCRRKNELSWVVISLGYKQGNNRLLFC
jgi:hypothetical protein